MGIFSFLFGGAKRALPLAGAQREPEEAAHKAAATPTEAVPVIVWRSASYPMEVVGEAYYQDALIAICGPHSRTGHEQEYPSQLRRDPNNRYDSNAVGVWVMGRQVGHLSRQQAERVSKLMTEAGLHVVGCAARIRGGWRTNQYDEGHFGVRLAMPSTGWIDFGIGAEEPAPSPRAETEPKAITPASCGPLMGEKVALQGAAASSEVAMELASAGAQIMSGPGKTTTLFVVNAIRPFTSGTINSSSHRKATELSIPIVSIEEVRARIKAGT